MMEQSAHFTMPICRFLGPWPFILELKSQRLPGEDAVPLVGLGCGKPTPVEGWTLGLGPPPPSGFASTKRLPKLDIV